MKSRRAAVPPRPAGRRLRYRLPVVVWRPTVDEWAAPALSVIFALASNDVTRRLHAGSGPVILPGRSTPTTPHRAHAASRLSRASTRGARRQSDAGEAVLRAAVGCDAARRSSRIGGRRGATSAVEWLGGAGVGVRRVLEVSGAAG